MIYRRFEAEDKPDVLALLRASFDGWHGDLSDAYWDWKFERNPHGTARIWVCDDGGSIAGCYVLNPARLSLGATTISGAQSVDAAVHPDQQGRGIFTSLVHAATAEAPAEGIDLIFAFPSEGAYGGQIRADFRSAFPVPTVYRSLSGLSPRRGSSDSFAFRTVTSFDARFAAFCGRASDQVLIPRRDPDYLEWRYNQHPLLDYETLICERDGVLCGYAVLTVDSNRRFSPGHIVDFQVLPESDSAAASLLREALHRLRSRGSRVAVTWARPASIEQEAIRSCGFSTRYVALRRRITRTRYVGQFIVFDVGTVPALQSPALGWSLVLGDADYG